MAKKSKQMVERIEGPKHTRTSIGRGTNCVPANKHKRRTWKKYRGQG